MKARLLLDGGKPKVGYDELRRLVVRSGIEVTDVGADIGIVVGGDGRFSRYGRTEDTPLLFVGVRSKGATGSKAYLAATTFDALEQGLASLKSGAYTVVEHRRLRVALNGKTLGEVFTDVYLERGAESTCIRYNVKVDGGGSKFTESAIGDGVVISTRAGSTGYYSYPDRVKGEWMDPNAFASIGANEVGVCHIAPTFTERRPSGGHPLRYRVPWGSKIRLSLFREADARLYGTTDSRAGVRVKMGDRLVVDPGKKVTRVIRL